VLPNFVGIGVPRGGSTWLHALLGSHPDAFVPIKRKEVHYWDNEFGRGEAWYASFFPSDAGSYVAVGEVTPHYLYSEAAAERLRASETVRRLICTLRNPVERMFSHYTLRMRVDNYRGTFREFAGEYPNSIDWGCYGRHLGRYRSRFGDDELLILIHERMFRDVDATRRAIAAHLGLDADRFPEGAGEQRVNTVQIPRFRAAYRMASKIGVALHRANLIWLSNLVSRRLGLKRLLGTKGAEKPELSAEDRAWAYETFFADDIAGVERELGFELPEWRL